jgi:hypothetical protein
MAITASTSLQGSSDQNGVSPTHALAAAIIPKGTPIVIRLQSPLSSDVSRPGDIFNAVLDEPIVFQGETLAPRGAVVTGRVVSASPSGALYRPGFLRLTLSSVEIAGKTLSVQTSAVFAKSVSRNAANPQLTPATLKPSSILSDSPAALPSDREVKFSTGRQLIFWLVQASPIQN